MSQTIERTALTQLVTNEQYARKVLPFMKGSTLRAYCSLVTSCERAVRSIVCDVFKIILL